MESPISFSTSSSPDTKVAPIVIAGAALVGRAVAGGIISGATTWGVNRVLDNRFPSKR
jgi:hypothetical protein